jgi:uncharacterized protein YjbJ (UPF0337 family)
MSNSRNYENDKLSHQSSFAKSPCSGVEQLIDNTMRQQKQQKQQQREPQQQPGGKIVNSDTPDAPLKEREQTYQSRLYQTQHLGEQQKQNQPQQQQQSSPAIDVIKAKWQKHVGAAKVVWGKLTDDELLQSEGQVDKLSGLVRERYAISRYEADNQVKNFLDKCKS